MEHPDSFALRIHVDLAELKQRCAAEKALLIDQGRLPPHETGLLDDEMARLGIHPTYELSTAADLLGLDVDRIHDAILGDQLDAFTFHDGVLVTISALYRYAHSQGLTVNLPWGGDWDDVDDAVRRPLRLAQERRVWETCSGRPELLAELLRELGESTKRRHRYFKERGEGAEKNR